MADEVSNRLYALTRRRAFLWLEARPRMDPFTRRVMCCVVDRCRGRANAKSARAIQHVAAFQKVERESAEHDRRGIMAAEVLTALREDPDGPRLPLVSSEVGWYIPESFEDMFISVRQTRSRILRLKEKLGRLWATYKSVLEALSDLEPKPETLEGLGDVDGGGEEFNGRGLA